MIHQLKTLGFTEIEAKCYIYLYENPHQTGYEVAKNIGVSRSNVYASLSALVQKGMCRVSDGNSVSYDAVDIEEVLDAKKQAFKKASKDLQRQLKKGGKEHYRFYNSYGEAEVKAVIERTIAHAKTSIIADIWPEDIPLFLPYLELAKERGVEVSVISFEKLPNTAINVIVDKKVDGGSAYRKFSVVCDGVKALIGSMDSQTEVSALETHHPAIVELLMDAYRHDSKMAQI